MVNGLIWKMGDMNIIIMVTNVGGKNNCIIFLRNWDENLLHNINWYNNFNELMGNIIYVLGNDDNESIDVRLIYECVCAGLS